MIELNFWLIRPVSQVSLEEVIEEIYKQVSEFIFLLFLQGRV
jgi:hypothetical protein